MPKSIGPYPSLTVNRSENVTPLSRGVMNCFTILWIAYKGLFYCKPLCSFLKPPRFVSIWCKTLQSCNLAISMICIILHWIWSEQTHYMYISIVTLQSKSLTMYKYSYFFSHPFSAKLRVFYYYHCLFISSIFTGLKAWNSH